jgi:hypothetical protein
MAPRKVKPKMHPVLQHLRKHKKAHISAATVALIVGLLCIPVAEYHWLSNECYIIIDDIKDHFGLMKHYDEDQQRD